MGPRDRDRYRLVATRDNGCRRVELNGTIAYGGTRLIRKICRRNAVVRRVFHGVHLRQCQIQRHGPLHVVLANSGCKRNGGINGANRNGQNGDGNQYLQDCQTTFNACRILSFAVRNTLLNAYPAGF